LASLEERLFLLEKTVTIQRRQLKKAVEAGSVQEDRADLLSRQVSQLFDRVGFLETLKEKKIRVNVKT